MTRASTPQTLRLICLTTSLPDEVKQGCIPAREACGLVTLPTNVGDLSLPHLRRPPQFSQIILAEDCVCLPVITQTDPLTHPLTGPEDAPPSVRSGNASFRPAGGPFSLQPREAQEASGVSRETPITHTAALKDRDYGTWHGQALNTLAPEGLHALLHDPDFAPPEGESLRQLHARVETWLTTLPQEEAARGTISAAPRATGSGAQTLLIIARPSVARALACAILGGGPEMVAKLDIPPQTTSLFTHHAGHWRVRALGAGQETGRKSQG